MEVLILITVCFLSTTKGLPADGFTFETPESDLTVNEGQTIKLICIFENVRVESLASVEWSKINQKSITIAKGDQVVSDALKERVEIRRENVQSMLVIREARDEDAGEYVCTLTENEEKQERRFSVIVRGAPLIQSASQSILSASPGDDVTLTCETSGSFPATVRWTRPGSTLPNGQDEVLADVLKIEDVKLKDSGIYQCTAMDDRGRSVRRMVEVEVQRQGDTIANSAKTFPLESFLLRVMILKLLVFF